MEIQDRKETKVKLELMGDQDHQDVQVPMDQMV